MVIGDTQAKNLSGGLKAARAATVEMTTQLRRFNKLVVETRKRATTACRGGTCPVPDGSAVRASDGAASRPTWPGFSSAGSASNVLGGLAKSLSSDLNGILRGLVSNLGRAISGGIRQQAGGGLFGGLLGSLVGGGIDLLVGKLFRKQRRVEVANTVQTEVLNFPRLSDLGFATNPASRLLGGRSVPRGPAFTVTVDYRNGAEDVIAAKVASHLAQLNELHGRF